MTHKARTLIAAAAALILHAATAAAQTDPKATVTALARIIKNHQKSVVDPFVEKTFSKFRKNAEVATGIADAYFYNAKDTAQAFRYINAAISANPAHVPAYLLAGQIMQHEYYSDTTVALNWYRQGIKAVPANPECYIKYAKLISRINYNYAIDKLEEMRTAIPSYPTDLEIARLCHDLVLNKIDANVNNQRALEHYNKTPLQLMTDYDLTDFLIYLNLTNSLGRMREVAAYGHNRNKRSADFNRMLFTANYKLKNYTEALSNADTLFNHSDSAKILIQDMDMCSKCYINLNQYGKAIEMLEKLADRNDISENDKISLIQQVALCYSEMGEYDKTINKYQEYLNKSEAAGTLTPDDYLRLANIYRDMALEKNGTEAIDAFRKYDETAKIVIDKFPDDFDNITYALYMRIQANQQIDIKENGSAYIKRAYPSKPYAEKLATMLMGKTDLNQYQKNRLKTAYQELMGFYYKGINARTKRTAGSLCKQYAQRILNLDPENPNANGIMESLNKMGIK